MLVVDPWRGHLAGIIASRHRVNTARAWAIDIPGSPQAAVITVCWAHVASDSPSRRQSRITRSALWRAGGSRAGSRS